MAEFLDIWDLIGLRDGLRRARGSGVRVLHYEGKRIEYATDAEMAAAITDLSRRITEATTPRRGGAITFTTSKGFL